MPDISIDRTWLDLGAAIYGMIAVVTFFGLVIRAIMIGARDMAKFRRSDWQADLLKALLAALVWPVSIVVLAIRGRRKPSLPNAAN